MNPIQFAELIVFDNITPNNINFNSLYQNTRDNDNVNINDNNKSEYEKMIEQREYFDNMINNINNIKDSKEDSEKSEDLKIIKKINEITDIKSLYDNLVIFRNNKEYFEKKIKTEYESFNIFIQYLTSFNNENHENVNEKNENENENENNEKNENNNKQHNEYHTKHINRINEYTKNIDINNVKIDKIEKQIQENLSLLLKCKISNNIQNNKICGICQEKEVDHVLVKCGHTYCSDCSLLINNKCSYCRTVSNPLKLLFN